MNKLKNMSMYVKSLSEILDLDSEILKKRGGGHKMKAVANFFLGMICEKKDYDFFSDPKKSFYVEKVLLKKH